MISPLGELRQKALVACHANGGIAPVRHGSSARRGGEQFVDWVSGACLLVRRARRRAVGLLDERYFLYTEDVDFCAAIRARGRRILFTPAAEITHLRGRSRATRAGRDESRPTAAASSRSTRSTTRAGRRSCALTCASRAPPRTATANAARVKSADVRIAIDARKLRDYGIGTYIRNLLRHLSRLDQTTEYVLLCREQDCERRRRRSAANFRARAGAVAGLLGARAVARSRWTCGASAPTCSTRRTTCCRR